MKKKLLTIALSLILLLPSVAGAVIATDCNWYVATTGNDGDGSLVNPWGPTEVVWGGVGMTDGDTVCYLPGTYTTAMNTLGMFQTSDNFPGSITIKAYDSDNKPTLNAFGQDRHCLYADNTGIFTVDGIICIGDLTRVYNGITLGSSTPIIKVRNSGFDTWGNVGVVLRGDGAEFMNSYVKNTGNNSLGFVGVSNAEIGFFELSNAETNDLLAIHDGIGDTIWIHDGVLTANAAAEDCIDSPDASGTYYTNLTFERLILNDCPDAAVRLQTCNGLVMKDMVINNSHGYGFTLGKTSPVHPTTTPVTISNVFINGWDTLGTSLSAAFLSYVDIVHMYNVTFKPGALTATLNISLADGNSGIFKNNVVQAHPTGRWMQSSPGVVMANYTFDNNVYFDGQTNGFNINTIGYTFETWRSTFIGKDIHSYNVDPKLNSVGCPVNSNLWEAGSWVEGGSYWGNAPAIGYCDHMAGSIFPGNIILSTYGGFKVRGGKIFLADTHIYNETFIADDYFIQDSTLMGGSAL